MSEEKKIEIINDENGVIDFNDITIIHDSVNREEVVRVKEEIANLEQQKLDIEARIVGLRVKLEYAERIIALADEKKAQEVKPIEA